MTYETFVSLWLNMGRARLQNAAAIYQGVSYLFSTADLPLEYFDAVAAFEEEAAELAFDAQVERDKGRAGM